MNRFKLWLYLLVLSGAGVAALAFLSREQVGRASRDADATLSAAVAQIRTSGQLMAAEAAAIVGLAVRDQELLQALYVSAVPPGSAGRKARAPATSGDETAEATSRQARVERAAKGAVESAASALGIEIPNGSWWVAASREWIEKKLPGASEGPQREAAEFLRDGAAGKPRRGYARVNDGLWFGVGMPAGEGAALVLFLPLDMAWARMIARQAGVDVTLATELPRPVATVAAGEAKLVSAAATRAPGTPADAGVLGKLPGALGPLKLSPVPLLFAKAPAARALAIALDGAKGFAVVSAPMAPRLGALVRAQWIALAGLAALLVLGVVIGLFFRAEGAAPIPEELVSTATRLEQGDFTVRAPMLAGKLGTLAEGMNRAAEAAQRSAADDLRALPAAAEAEPAAAGDLLAPPVPAEAAPSPLEIPVRGRTVRGLPAALAPEPTPAAKITAARFDGGGRGLIGGQFAAAPVPARDTAVAFPAAAPQSAAQAAPAATDTEEGHWQQVFEEFLRVREQCDEATEGLTFERFREKLEKNKGQLLKKYGCRTVRFQVYVKDGKAALKATPVK